MSSSCSRRTSASAPAADWTGRPSARRCSTSCALRAAARWFFSQKPTRRDVGGGQVRARPVEAYGVAPSAGPVAGDVHVDFHHQRRSTSVVTPAVLSCARSLPSEVVVGDAVKVARRVLPQRAGCSGGALDRQSNVI